MIEKEWHIPFQIFVDEECNVDEELYLRIYNRYGRDCVNIEKILDELKQESIIYRSVVYGYAINGQELVHRVLIYTEPVFNHNQFDDIINRFYKVREGQEGLAQYLMTEAYVFDDISEQVELRQYDESGKPFLKGGNA